MLFSIIVFWWLGIKTQKHYKRTKAAVILYLSLFLLFSGAGIAGYLLRMIFAEWPTADTVFLMIGGIFQISGVLSGLIFSLFLFKVSWAEKRLKLFFIIAVVIITGLSLVVFLLPVYEINEISPDPYSLFSAKRTEFVFIAPVKILMAIVIILPLLIICSSLFREGFKNKEIRKKSWLISLGFLLYLMAMFFDGVAFTPLLLWMWRLLYGISGLVIYKSFTMKA